MTVDANFIFWVTLLTLMLLYPAAQWIWKLSVGRLQRKLQRELNDEEIAGQRRRAYVLALVICFFFSVLYNASMLGAWG